MSSLLTPPPHPTALTVHFLVQLDLAKKRSAQVMPLSLLCTPGFCRLSCSNLSGNSCSWAAGLVGQTFSSMGQKHSKLQHLQHLQYSFECFSKDIIYYLWWKMPNFCSKWQQVRIGVERCWEKAKCWKVIAWLQTVNCGTAESKISARLFRLWAQKL